MLKDKVVIITGASSGIGKAIALLCATKQAKLGLIARNKERLSEVVNLAKSYSLDVKAAICDIRNQNQVEQTFQEFIKHFGKIDILINNAGTGIYKPIDEQTIEEIHDQMAVNYFGTVYCTKQVLPTMIKQGQGHIINIASVAGKTGFPKISGYAAAKHAVVGFSESCYFDLQPKGIHVSVINPSSVDTNFFEHETWKQFPHEERHKTMASSEHIAKIILQTIKTKPFEVFTSKDAELKNVGKNLLPKFYRKKVMALKR